MDYICREWRNEWMDGWTDQWYMYKVDVWIDDICTQLRDDGWMDDMCRVERWMDGWYLFIEEGWMDCLYMQCYRLYASMYVHTVESVCFLLKHWKSTLFTLEPPQGAYNLLTSLMYKGSRVLFMYCFIYRTLFLMVSFILSSQQNLRHTKVLQNKVPSLSPITVCVKSASLAISLLIKPSHNGRQREACVNNALITIASMLWEAAPACREFKYLWGIPSSEKCSALCSAPPLERKARGVGRWLEKNPIVRSSMAVQCGVHFPRPRQRAMEDDVHIALIDSCFRGLWPLMIGYWQWFSNPSPIDTDMNGESLPKDTWTWVDLTFSGFSWTEVTKCKTKWHCVRLLETMIRYSTIRQRLLNSWNISEWRLFLYVVKCDHLLISKVN